MEKQSFAVQPARAIRPVRFVQPETLLERVNRMHDLITRRAFELFQSRGSRAGRELEDWFRAESELLQPVHVEVRETDDALTVRAEVPGFSDKDLEVSVEPQKLTIAGKRETQEERRSGKNVYTERSADEILRVVELPAEIETERVAATLRDGVLTLELPKAAKAHKVTVQARTA